MARWQDYVLQGTRAAQPAATTVAVGTIYGVTDESNVIERSDGSAWSNFSPAGGGLINIQTITATGAGTYTPTAGTTSVVIELQGAGGGGGGAAQPATTAWALARAGQGGGWLLVRLSTAFSGAAYSVGAGGAGGTAGNNAGVTGGNTVFTATGGGGTVYTAGGGTGGSGSASLGLAPVKRDPMTSGGLCTNGTLMQDGWIGTTALVMSTDSGTGGFGGNSRYGQGGFQSGVSIANSQQAGGDATGKGAGGGAGVSHGTGTNVAGGNGTDGVLVIYEFG